MLDFYVQLRRRMIDSVQLSLKQIRQVLGLGVQECADLLGITRQTVNNLESGKNSMNSVQYLAICTVIDNYTEDKPKLMAAISGIIQSNAGEANESLFENIEQGTLLRKWFYCFPSADNVFNVVGNTNVDNGDFIDIAEKYKVFLDDTILSEQDFIGTLCELAISMKNANNKFIIPFKVIVKLEKDMMSNNKDVSRKAKSGIYLLNSLSEQDLLDVRGEKSDFNISSTLISVFAKFKPTYHLALITQDKNLAKKIEALNDDVIGGFDILVLYYDQSVGLQRWNDSIVEAKKIIEQVKTINVPSEKSLDEWRDL